MFAAFLCTCHDPDGTFVSRIHGIGLKGAKNQFEELMVFLGGTFIMLHLRVDLMMLIPN